MNLISLGRLISSESSIQNILKSVLDRAVSGAYKSAKIRMLSFNLALV